MKKAFSFLVAAAMLFSLAGCEGNNRKAGNTLSGKADVTLSCVGKFLVSDGSWYLTEQKHEIYTASDAMRLTADEPCGQIVLIVQDGKLDIKKKAKTGVPDKDMLALMTDEGICKGLLGLYLAEIKPQSGSSQNGDIVFSGQAYSLLGSDNKTVELYKNKATKKNNLVISQSKKRYLLFGYNYLELETGGYIPSKIDIYLYNSELDKQLISQYTCRLN